MLEDKNRALQRQSPQKRSQMITPGCRAKAKTHQDWPRFLQI